MFSPCRAPRGAPPAGSTSLAGPKPTGTFQEPSPELVADKQRFSASRKARWFSR